MAEIEEEVTFETTADQVKFATQTNGDSLKLNKIHLSQAQATSLAWLVNQDHGGVLEWQVKVKK